MLKCIIWDLDNTIWNGTLLEDSDVVLNEEVIQVIKLSYDKGMVQTISSKNDFGMAMKKLKDFGIEHFFIYPQISFDSKANSIKKFIDDLHFRAEDVLFIDDMDSELAEVEYVISNIQVMNISELDSMKEVISKSSQMTTIEAINRIHSYKIEEIRLYEQKQYTVALDFLMQSDFTIQLQNAKESDLLRIKELLDRTHQLNTTGISYSEEDIKDMLSNKNWDIIIGSVMDKYGDYGKSALIIAYKGENHYCIKVMIVSCRLLGKGIANYLLYYGFELARINDCGTFCVDFVKNKYNRSMYVLLQMNSMKKNVYEENKYRFWVDTNEDTTCIIKPEWIKQI